MVSLVTGGKVEVAVVEALITETVVRPHIVSGDAANLMVPMRVLQHIPGAVISVLIPKAIASTIRISNITGTGQIVNYIYINLLHKDEINYSLNYIYNSKLV